MGKGLSVVAGEVKELAQQTATTSQDVSRVAADLQDLVAAGFRR